MIFCAARLRRVRVAAETLPKSWRYPPLPCSLFTVPTFSPSRLHLLLFPLFPSSHSLLPRSHLPPSPFLPSLSHAPNLIPFARPFFPRLPGGITAKGTTIPVVAAACPRNGNNSAQGDKLGLPGRLRVHFEAIIAGEGTWFTITGDDCPLSGNPVLPKAERPVQPFSGLPESRDARGRGPGGLPLRPSRTGGGRRARPARPSRVARHGTSRSHRRSRRRRRVERSVGAREPPGKRPPSERRDARGRGPGGFRLRLESRAPGRCAAAPGKEE